MIITKNMGQSRNERLEMSRRSGKGKAIGWILLILYVGVLLYFLFFSDILFRNERTLVRRANFTLFSQIRLFWNARHTNLQLTLVNLLGNIAIFVPFGFLVPSISHNKSYTNLFSVTAMAAMFSTLIEVMQILTKVGRFDVDDILLNTIGAVCGYLIYAIVRLFRRY